MSNMIIKVWLFQQAARTWLYDRTISDERGEGVISAAIAVLVMAFLGVGLWLAFKAILGSATTQVSNQVSQIGS
ncbi:MAG: hypothetical protein ACRDWV_08075 [Acidimicrobiales bacterium]